MVINSCQLAIQTLALKLTSCLFGKDAENASFWGKGEMEIRP
jgi:hypothetical protein